MSASDTTSCSDNLSIFRTLMINQKINLTHHKTELSRKSTVGKIKGKQQIRAKRKRMKCSSSGTAPCGATIITKIHKIHRVYKEPAVYLTL